jgi:hypothetical protein
MKIGVRANDLSPWYNVTHPSLRKIGFRWALYNSYGNGIYEMLKTIYPEHQWVPWRFAKLPTSVVRNPLFEKEALRYIEKERKLSKPEDWYRVTDESMKELGVFYLISKSGGLFEVLKKHRPEFRWQEEQFVCFHHTGLKTLGIYLSRIWPYLEILKDYELTSREKVSYFIPSLKLAIDYQSLGFYRKDNVQDRKVSLSFTEDKEKKSLAFDQGMEIVFIPFWWDRKISSLMATLLQNIERLKDKSAEGNSNLGSIWNNTSSKPIPNKTVVEISNWRKGSSRKFKVSEEDRET